MTTRAEPPLRILDLGRRAYGPALQLQEEMVQDRKADRVPDTLILVEHDPVYTLGRNAKEGNVLLSEADLKQRGIEVFRIGRGGDVTYHGPGQLEANVQTDATDSDILPLPGSIPIM